MIKFLRVFRTEEEYLEYTASTEFNLNSVSRCREGSLVFYDPADCGSQGIHRTISGETYCNGYDKYVYLYKQVSYDDGVTWETTATTSSLIEKDSEDCGYVPPTPPSDWDITVKFNVTSTGPTKIARSTSSFTKIEIDGVEQPSVETGYTFNTTGEHTVKYKLNGTSIGSSALYSCTNITNVVISDKVTHIGHMAFTNCSGITSVTIPNSITSIGNGVFQSCTSLTSIGPVGSGASVEIPNSLRSLNVGTFSRCTSLTSVTIPDSIITVVGFSYCDNLTSCTIGSGVTTIFDYAFEEDSSLTSINIPSGVTSIGREAFDNCTSLTSVTVNAVTPPTLGTNAFNNTNNCPIYVPCDSVDAYKSATKWSTYASRIQAISGSCWDITAKFNVTDTTNPTPIGYNQYTSGFSVIEIDGVAQPSVVSAYTFSTTGEHIVRYMLTDPTSIGITAFSGCTSLTSCTIGSGVTSIGWGAFRYCSGLTTCTIGSGVTSIGDDAFAYCSCLTSIDIPDSVTSIGWGAFQYCSGLTSCTIGSGVTSIGNYAFANCSGLTSIDIPDSVTSIGISGFSNCSSITSVTIPDSVTSIGRYAFASCNSLTSCTIGSGVTSIGDGAFRYCSGLTSIDIPSGVTRIGEYAFDGCYGLTSCTIGSGATSIGDGAFRYCSGLTSIDIPSGVTSISDSIFKYCRSLTSVTIPDSVTSIGWGAFSSCSGLTSITSNAVTAPTIKSSTFQNVKTGGTLYVPIGSSGYNTWMGTGSYYLGMYNWTKVEQ